MPGSDYQSDIQYTIASGLEVFQGQPSNEEGNEGDERWCWIENTGLFLAKKYNGSWRFLTSSLEALEAGVQSDDSTTGGGGGGTTSAPSGSFTTLSVSSSSSLNGSTGIAGTLGVTATTLSAFPTSANLQITNQKLDTIQNIQTSSAIQFNEIGLGTSPSGEAGNIELSTILGVSAADIINNILKISETNYTNVAGSSLTDGLGLEDLTQAEANQLKNIGSSTISADQWGYVGALDQHLTTASNVQFGSVKFKQNNWYWVINMDSSTGKLYFEPPSTTDNNIIFGSDSRDDSSLQNYNYTSGLFTGDGWSIYEYNNQHNMEIDNLAVRGTLSVYELLIQQVRATNGSVFVTSAGKLVSDPDDGVTHINGTSTYTIAFETDSDNTKPHPFADGDLILARKVETGSNDLIKQVKATVTDASHGNSNQAKITIQEWTVASSGPDANPPAQGKSTQAINGFDFVRVGNTTDLNRQGGIYLTSDDTMSPFMDIFNEVSGWEQWDGITSAFDFTDGSFDGLTTTASNTSWTAITGTQTNGWEFKGANGGGVSFPTTGGVTNDNYALLNNNGSAGGSKIRQKISFPDIASGTYKVTITWYAKSNLDGRIALQEVNGTSYVDYFNASGTYVNASGSTTPDYVNFSSISSPASQPTINANTWQRYEWEVTVPSSETADSKQYYLEFAPYSQSGATLNLNNVKMSLPNKVKTRVGNIQGVGASGYGLWGENVWLSGRLTATSGFIGDELQGWEISSTGIKNASTSAYISSGQSSVGLDNGGIYLGGTGQFSAGNSASNGIKWDGSTLTVRGSIHVGSGGSVDESLVPGAGKLLKCVVGGYGTSTATMGFFEANSSDGTMTTRLGNTLSNGTSVYGQVAVWDPSAGGGNGAFDTSFNSNGFHIVTSSDALETSLTGIANGKIVIVMINSSAGAWLETNGSAYDAGLRTQLKYIGATEFALQSTGGNSSGSQFTPYILVGMKKASAHTAGTELQGYLGADTGVISLTLNLKNNVVDILDHEGPLNDFDAGNPPGFAYHKVTGYAMKRQNLISSNVDRVVLSFPMPRVNPEDTANVYLYFTSKNLGDEGQSPVTLKLNGSTIESAANLEDPDDDYQYNHTIHSIGAQYFKTGLNEVNVFQFTMDMNANADTNYIYDFELRDSQTGQVYSGGDLASPEGNLYTNPGFEVGAVANATSVNSWYVNQTDSGFSLSGTEYWTGAFSLKYQSPNSQTARHMSQSIVFPSHGEYVMRWRYKFNSTWQNYSVPTFSLYTQDACTSGTIFASLNVNADGSHTWHTTNGDTGGTLSDVKQWNAYDSGNVGSFADAYAGEWQTFEFKFTVPSQLENRAVATNTEWTTQFYTGGRPSQQAWWDHMQIFKVKSDASAEEKGLYMTSDRLGFYNGTGGLNGWATLIKDDGSFFFGDRNSAANLATPSSGGPYIRFNNAKLEINADMVAGIIQSENWGASAGTRISLADGTINTGGTNSPKFQLASDGTVNLNGAALSGGTITGQLFQSNYAEGAVTFVTKKETGINAVNNFTVNVNGVERLICDRIAESVEMDFGEADDLASSGTTKSLGIYGYDHQGLNTLNRTADTLGNTTVTFTGGAPFYIGAAATNDGNNDNDELVHFRFRIGTSEDNFYIYHKTRIVPTTPNKGYVKVRGSLDNSNWTDIISANSSNDFYKAGTGTWTLPSGLVIFGFATSDYQDAGDIIDMKTQWYISGSTTGMYSGTTGLEITVDQIGNGSYVQTSNTMFGPAVWKVYN